MASVFGQINDADVVQLTNIASLRGQAVLNVWYMRVSSTGPLSGNDAQKYVNKLAQLWGDFYIAQFAPLFVPQWNYVGTRCTHIWETTGPVNGKFKDRIDFAGEHIQFAVGTHAADDELPPFNAVGVQIKTDRAGKTGRGAKRFAGIPESKTLESNLTVPYWTSWQDTMNGVLGAWSMFAVANGPPEVSSAPLLCLFDRKASTAMGNPPGEFILPLHTHYVVNQVITSQTSRKIRGNLG